MYTHIHTYVRDATNGVDTNGAAAKVMIACGEKCTPWHFREDESRLTGVPQKSPSKNMKIAVTPLVLTPFVPSQTSDLLRGLI